MDDLACEQRTARRAADDGSDPGVYALALSPRLLPSGARRERRSDTLRRRLPVSAARVVLGFTHLRALGRRARPPFRRPSPARGERRGARGLPQMQLPVSRAGRAARVRSPPPSRMRSDGPPAARGTPPRPDAGALVVAVA